MSEANEDNDYNSEDIEDEFEEDLENDDSSEELEKEEE